MNVAVYSTKDDDQKYFEHVNASYEFELQFLTSRSAKQRREMR